VHSRQNQIPEDYHLQQLHKGFVSQMFNLRGLHTLLAMAVFAYFGCSFRQRGGVAVTAFSIASTFSSRRATSGAFAAAGSSSSTFRSTLAFRRVSGTSLSSLSPRISTLKVQMSSTALAVPLELEKKMDVEHPAYEIIQKDFVEEYGAATTLYRHKKSGAELLSVSSDDDNKVFGITFRTPRK
jgi:hypothetical protein